MVPSADGIDPVEEMEDIVTPVNAERLAHWLDGYEEDAKSFLIKGFRAGFSLQCTHNPSVGSTLSQPLNNHKSAVDQPEILQQLLGIELEAKRIAGPFNTIPFPDLHVSPLSLRPKKELNKFRLIHDLSFPKDCSVNAGISKEDSTVVYETLDTAISYIQEVGPGAF